MNIRMSTQEEIHAAFEKGEATVGELFIGVEIPLEELAGQLEKQAAAPKELQVRLEKNRRNRSQLPSSDGYRKPRRTVRLRKPGQTPNGGQPGQEGYTLKPSAHQDIQAYLRQQMPVWSKQYPGVEEMTVAVMGCVVNGPGESKLADVGISLPGTGEYPVAPVYVDGEKTVTLKGNTIAVEFQRIVDDYVKRRYGAES
jgi:hypothetical protein